MKRLLAAAGFFAAAGSDIRPRLRARALLPALLAAFALVPVATAAAAELEVKLAGLTTGTVTGSLVSGGTQVIDCSNAAGLPAGPTCSAAVGTAAAVELSATPGLLSYFAGWTVAGTPFSNTCTGETSPCRVAPLTTKVTVTATFEVAASTAEVEFPATGVQPVQDLTATAATFHGAVNPRESLLEACGFEVVSQAEPQGFASSATKKLPCSPGPGAIGEGNGFIPVEATASGLEPNTLYHVRLLAEKENSAPRSVTVEAPSFTTETTAPDLTTEAAWSISDTAATLTATVNTHNSALTDCHFAYGLASEGYPSTAPCDLDSAAGEATENLSEFPVDNTSHSVIAEIAGLQPNAAYHFRIVADNGAGGSQEGTPVTLTTRTAAESELPQRGYELVSAANTSGNGPLPDLASADGEDFVYYTYIPVPGAEDGIKPFFRSTRNTDGTWSQHYIGEPTPVSGGRISVMAGPLFSADLSTVAFASAQSIDPNNQNKIDDDTYLADAGGGVTWLSRNPAIEGPQTEGGDERPVYISPGGQRVLFMSTRRLLPADLAAFGQNSLYEWDEGRLSLVSFLPGQANGSVTTSELGSDAENREGGTVAHAVSGDGSRIVFQALDGAKHWHLYIRIDGEHTVEVSASAPAVSPPVTSPQRVMYVGADTEDENVFFTCSSALTTDSTAPNTETGPVDLYDYEVANETLRDLTPFPGGAGVKRVYDISEDGHRIYFTSAKRLDGEGVEGGPNLYLAELTGSQVKLIFIATVDPLEEEPERNSEIGAGGGLWAGESSRELAANPDGSVLAFRSSIPLVPGRQTGGRQQVFVYETERHELSCASCSPEGAPAPTSAELTPSSYLFAVGKGAELQTYGTSTIPYAQSHGRNVSTNGTVFFQTASSLVPTDTNGKIDVYEWHGGRISLTSSGTGTQDSMFGDASTDGSTIFFRSAASLVPGAQDGIQHIYAAVAGVPTYAPPTPAPPCDGEDCRGQLSSPPTAGPPASAAFSGSGNLLTQSVVPTKPKAKPLTNAQKLGKALRACDKDRKKAKRKRCETSARRKYRSKPRAKAKKKRGR